MCDGTIGWIQIHLSQCSYVLNVFSYLKFSKVKLNYKKQFNTNNFSINNPNSLIVYSLVKGFDKF